jgi:subtilisin family serine protease
VSRIQQLLTEMKAKGAPASDYERAEISLVFPSPTSQAEADAAVGAAVGGAARIVVEPAFKGDLAKGEGGRFWIVGFPEIRALGTETEAFELARELKDALGLSSARPVLVDSLVGAAMADPAGLAEADAAGFCNGDNMGPTQHGWAPFALGALEAWKTTQGQGVTVASIDTGISDHDELAGVLSAKAHLNLVEGGADAKDRFSTDVMLANPGHGTLVASVVASRGTIGPGAEAAGPGQVTGMAPKAEVLPIRAIRSVVDMRQSNIPAAIEHALAQKADVIVMALGSGFHIEPVEFALSKAAAAGVVTVCAAGNCVGFVVFPARLATKGLVTAVAGVDHAFMPWEATSKGPEVVVSAFGEAVWGAAKRKTADPNNVVARSQGTTLAASLTAGVAALWVAAHGRDALKAAAAQAGTTVQRMFNALIAQTAHRPPGWRDGLGAGLVNAGRLIAEPLPAPADIPSDPPEFQAFTPLKRFLAPTLSDSDALAAAEASTLEEDDAAEALWLLYKANARRRAVAFGMTAALGEGDAVAAPRSPQLAAKLAQRPRLAALAF